MMVGMSTVDYDVVVVGAGNGGLSAAAFLKRRGCRDVALVEPRASRTTVGHCSVRTTVGRGRLLVSAVVVGAIGRLLRQVAGQWAYLVGPHHLVVLVLDDVAVPGVPTGKSKCALRRVISPGNATTVSFSPRSQAKGACRRVESDGAPVEHLELHLVQVDRVGIRGEV